MLTQSTPVDPHARNDNTELGDARRFLARVVPWDGKSLIGIHYTVSSRHGGKPIWRGTPCVGLEGAIRQLDFILKRHDTLDVYVCMSSQRECETKLNPKSGKPFKIAVRKRENAVALKSLYLDIDVKSGGYSTTRDATQALAKFIHATGMPKPTAVVESGGGGLHVHWALSEALSVEKWQALADALVAAVKEHGLLCDTGCTVDAARILRIPGTFNNKKSPKSPVKLAMLRDVPCILETVERVLAKWIGVRPSHNVVAFRANNNDELSAGIEMRKATPRRLEDLRRECPFVDDAYTTGGAALDQPQWNITTLLAAFLENGRDAAHWMADQHPGYTTESTDELFERKQREIETKGVGWPSCAAIKCAGSKFCDVCRHGGEGRSPLHFVLPKPATLPAGGGADVTLLPGESLYPLAFNTLATSGKAFTHDVFHGRMFVDGLELSDEVCGELRNYIIREANKDPGKDHVFEAARALCALGKFNPVVDYLQGLEWDGQSRLDTWLIDYAGAEDTLLNRAIGRKFLIGMSRRALFPGSKFDTALMLEAAQGTGKSSLAAALAGSDDNFLDHDITSLTAKEQMEALRGRWIVELPELSGMRRTDVNTIKAFMSRATDRGRPAYGRVVVDQPRTCVFIGTVNEGQYLRDETGNRRFWTVAVGKIDVRGVAVARDLLLAEAVAAVQSGEDAILPSSLWAVAAVEQDKRRIEDPWAELLEALQGKAVTHQGESKLFVSNDDVWSRLSVLPDRRNGSMGERVNRMMNSLGWTRARIKLAGQTTRGYLRAASTTALRTVANIV